MKNATDAIWKTTCLVDDNGTSSVSMVTSGKQLQIQLQKYSKNDKVCQNAIVSEKISFNVTNDPEEEIEGYEPVDLDLELKSITLTFHLAPAEAWNQVFSEAEKKIVGGEAKRISDDVRPDKVAFILDFCGTEAWHKEEPRDLTGVKCGDITLPKRNTKVFETMVTAATEKGVRFIRLGRDYTDLFPFNQLKPEERSPSPMAINYYFISK